MNLPTEIPVQQFVLDKSRFGEVRKKLLVRGAPLMLLSLAAGLGIGYLNGNSQQDQPSFLLVMGPFFILVYAFGMYRGIQRQKAQYTSYCLQIDELGITREQVNTPTIRLDREKISALHKSSDGSYSIKGDSLNNSILIPAQVENPVALEESLTRFGPLQAQPQLPVAFKALRLLPVLTLVLMVVVYVSVNKAVVAICGTSLLGILGYSFVVSQRSKHVDGKTKRGIWLVLIVIASVMAVMYAKLFT